MRKVSEKVWDYLVEHKTPASSQTIADYFLVTRQSVRSVLGELTRNNVLDKIRIGNNYHYRIKE